MALAIGMMTLTTGVKAETVDIPTKTGTYISWNNATGTGYQVENSGANVGSTGKNTQLQFNINNTQQQDYLLTFKTGTKSAAKMKVTLTGASGQEVLSRNVDIVNTNSWTPSIVHNYMLKQLPAGAYTLKFAVTQATSYAGNWGDLAFQSLDDMPAIPGTIGLTQGSYGGGVVNEGANVGYIKDGGTAAYTVLCRQAGVYSLSLDVARYGTGGTLAIDVRDAETGAVEASTTYTIRADAPSDYQRVSIVLPGEIGTGLKVLTLSFAGGSGYICNYRNLRVDYYAAHLAAIGGISIDGQTVTRGTDTDWLCNLPANYNQEVTTFHVDKTYGTVEVSAVGSEGQSIGVTDGGDGSYTLPTPARGQAAVVRLHLTPDTGAGAAAPRQDYTLRIFHIGEIAITRLTIDGVETDVADELNRTPYQASFNKNIYTSLPVVEAQLVDGSTVKGQPSALQLPQSTVDYTISARMGDMERTYRLTVGGVHVYNKVDGDETVVLKYTGAGKTATGWTDGLYTLSNVGDGWENSSFKLNEGDYTLYVPADVVVRQLTLKDFNANYNGGSLTAVSSEGARVWIPTKHDYEEPDATMYDLVLPIDGHGAGQPITLTLKGGGQPVCWIELTVARVAVASAPVLKSQSCTPTSDRNHCVVTLGFDREMQDTEATVGGQTVVAQGGSTVLRFAVWNLEYDSEQTLTVAAGAARDTYGNGNTGPISVGIKVGSRPATEKAPYDYVVGNVTQWRQALAAVNTLNKNENADQRVIFVRNGDYDFGGEEQSLKAYNVSIVGESRDGVVLHGNRDGITNPVLNLNNTGGVYLQDLTVRNDKDFGKARSGVGVAISGGRRVVMKNVAMQSQQDTQVTGESGYYVGCKIYGAVDYICGGGDHFYDRCELVMTNPGPITAPATSTLSRWGYVFQHCTVNAYPGFNADKNYDLGRPWQNEPRSYFLNTTMNVRPTDAGWRSMSMLKTHFYEYNSTDKDGNRIDLSKRQNSPTSTNKYTPVLSDEEARLFTVENVLGSTDSWLPTEETVTTAAPQVSCSGTTLSWPEVEDARCYVILCDGQYVTNQTTTTYNATGTGAYTVRSCNRNGGMGGESQPVGVQQSTLNMREKTPAFPGAEGYGRYVTGGRGGKVYHVTNLNDSGSGSLRWACGQSGTRTIVFDVSGTIHLKSQLKLRNGNVTIAGQTAPGDGICVADWDFVIAAPNVIIRYMRFRPGEASQGEPDGLGGYDGRDIIIDHCSISWSVDECCSVYGNEHMTVQWCIVSQSLRNSTHAKSAHGYGGNWGGKGATYHHNLVAHHDSRTPRFGNRPTFVQQDTTDYRCNVIYNWAGNGCYGGEGMKVNMVNNYYKPGPATDGRASGSRKPLAYRICGLGVSSKETDGSYHIWGKYYVDGNENPDYPALKTQNWEMGIYPQISTDNWGYTATTKDTMRLREPLPFMAVTTHTPELAYERVLAYAGASLHRDAVDQIVVDDTRQRKATFTGDTGKGDWPGIIDTPYDLRPADADETWNPWPTLATTAAPKDSDGDGMPDTWETENGLDPNDPADGNVRDSQGYTNLERYLNSLIAHITAAQNEGGTEEGYREYASEEDITGAISIPTDWLNPDKAEITINQSGKQAAKVLAGSFDSFSHGDEATFLLACKEPGAYTIKFDAATTRSDFKLKINIADTQTGKTEVSKTLTISNTGDWQSYKTYTLDTNEMTVGTKRLIMTWQSANGQYTGNVKNISITKANGTGISEIYDNVNSTLSNCTWFDLQGRQVGSLPTSTGIYISNGKKFIIK